ncbi:MAG: hemerythrin domain-containing protein [Defluviitaleaceae bacterium]|nr:hemerythrin domain-containing protein [Defluviitaleaceae bacterium]
MWKDSYALGVELIDNQHKELFFNVTESFVLSIHSPGAYMNRQYCINLINFLKGYAVRHFKDEEDYQVSIGYPGFNAHREQHECLKHDLAKYEKRLVDSNFTLPSMKIFLGFVLHWLMHHVAEEDSKIYKPASMAAAQ